MKLFTLVMLCCSCFFSPTAPVGTNNTPTESSAQPRTTLEWHYKYYNGKKYRALYDPVNKKYITPWMEM